MNPLLARCLNQSAEFLRGRPQEQAESLHSAPLRAETVREFVVTTPLVSDPDELYLRTWAKAFKRVLHAPQSVEHQTQAVETPEAKG